MAKAQLKGRGHTALPSAVKLRGSTPPEGGLCHRGLKPGVGRASGSQVGLGLEESGFRGENHSEEGGPRKASAGVSTGQSNAVLYPGVSLRGHQARYEDVYGCYDEVTPGFT